MFLFKIRRKADYLFENALSLHTFKFSLILLVSSIICFVLSWKVSLCYHNWLPDLFLSIGGGLITGFCIYVLTNIRNRDFEINRKRAEILPKINKKCFEIIRISDIYETEREKLNIETGRIIIQTMFDLYRNIIQYHDDLDMNMQCNISFIDPDDERVDYEYDYYVIQIKIWDADTIQKLDEINQKIVRMAHQISANIRQYGYSSIHKKEVLDKNLF